MNIVPRRNNLETQKAMQNFTEALKSNLKENENDNKAD